MKPPEVALLQRKLKLSIFLQMLGLVFGAIIISLQPENYEFGNSIAFLLGVSLIAYSVIIAVGLFIVWIKIRSGIFINEKIVGLLVFFSFQPLLLILSTWLIYFFIK